MGIPISIIAYNVPTSDIAYNGNPLYPLLRTVKIPTCISIAAYNINPYSYYCVQWQSPISVTAYNWIANENPHPKIPGAPPAAAKIANQNPLLRTMEIPISVTAYN